MRRPLLVALLGALSSIGAPVAAPAAEPVATSFPIAGKPAGGPLTGAFDGTVTALAPDTFLALRPDGTDAYSGTYADLPANDVLSAWDGGLWLAGTARVLRQPPTRPDTPQVYPVTGVAPDAAVADLALGPDGNVWFTVPSANKVGIGVPTSNTIDVGGSPIAIAQGSDGYVWFTQRSPAAIVRMTTNASTIEPFTAGLPGDAAPQAITLGPDGNMWFTDAAAPRVGRVTPDGTITMFDAVLSSSIVAGPDGNLWLAGGTTITTEGVLSARDLPADTLAVGADGNVWGTRAGVVSRLALGGQQFSNPTRVRVPATGASGKANVYPSPMTVSGLQGTVTKVTVRLNGIHHRSANDLQIMLVAPGGHSAVLMANVTSRTGDAGVTHHVLSGESIAFTEGARTADRRVTSGVFAPVDSRFLPLGFVAPAPPDPSGGLGQFAGTAPNGTWRLYIVDGDDTAGTIGVLTGGWSLDVETTGPPAPTPDVPATPAPPPAATPPANPAPDTTRPRLVVTGVPKRMTLRALRRGLRVRVTASEPVRVSTLLAIRATGAGSGTLLAGVNRDLAAPATLRLRPAFTARPAKRFTLLLRIGATDGAGNRTTVTRTISVTR